MMKMTLITILILVLSSLLLIGCEDERSNVIFGEKICGESDVYCHLFRSDAEQVNITFDSVNDDVFNYTVVD